METGFDDPGIGRVAWSGKKNPITTNSLSKKNIYIYIKKRASFIHKKHFDTAFRVC
jgi:hypothetical protein